MVAHTGHHVVVGLKNGQKVDYNQALKYCKEGGLGEISSITSSDQNNKIEKQMKVLNIEYAWIGLRRLYHERKDKTYSWTQTYWQDGTRFSYSNWASGQPNYLSKDENVIIALSNGWGRGWHDG